MSVVVVFLLLFWAKSFSRSGKRLLGGGGGGGGGRPLPSALCPLVEGSQVLKCRSRIVSIVESQGLDIKINIVMAYMYFCFILLQFQMKEQSKFYETLMERRRTETEKAQEV